MTEIKNFRNSRILKNKKHLGASSYPPFFWLSICGTKFTVLLSLSSPQISDKTESFLVMTLSKVWFASTFSSVFATFFHRVG